LEANFTAHAQAAGTHDVWFALSGTDKDYYYRPGHVSMNFNLGTPPLSSLFLFQPAPPLFKLTFSPYSYAPKLRAFRRLLLLFPLPLFRCGRSDGCPRVGYVNCVVKVVCLKKFWKKTSVYEKYCLCLATNKYVLVQSDLITWGRLEN
jgi:hypothetical protein